MYQIHPCEQLVERFRTKPYQGVDPREANFLFLGQDANYAADIAGQQCFPEVLEYLEDAPAFWRKYGVHHPFLRESYKGDGTKYHRGFAKIGFTSKHADRVSFLEVFHLPTVGKSRFKRQDLSTDHLEFVRECIFESAPKLVFIPNCVLLLMNTRTDIFPRLASPSLPGDRLVEVYRSNSATIFKHNHFSFHRDAEVAEIARRCGLTA